MEASGVELSRRLTAAEAQVQGLVPTGHIWDEATQQPIPRGVAIVEAQLAEPLDLQRNLEIAAKNRVTLLRFVAEQLVEAAYDTRGYPVPGRLGDYYVVPGAKTKALTKRGAENVGQLFRYAKGATKQVSSHEDKEYCSATVEVTLLDQFRRPVGSAISSCTTAEPGFRSIGARKKYGAHYQKQQGEYVEVEPPDFRAALNDVVARAGKRAFVQAMIVATAADEIFHVAEEDAERARQGADEPADRPAAPILPFRTRTYPKGTKLAELSGEELVQLRDWIQADLTRAHRLARFSETLELVLDERRIEETDEAPV